MSRTSRTHNFLCAVAHKIASANVPPVSHTERVSLETLTMMPEDEYLLANLHINTTICINSKDWCIGRIYEL